MKLQLDIIKSKIYTLDTLLPELIRWRLKDQKIVFTNGVFDLLHPGHIDYLAKTSDLGSKLIIGLNADVSVKMLNKGMSRPIQNEQDRALLLAALHFVDAVIIFTDETPAHLIAAILPDVLAKGGDYQPKEIAGNQIVIDNGGSVEIIPFLEGYSTSLIEQKIRKFKD